MSYPQLTGYTYSPTGPATITSPQLLVPGASTLSTPPSSNTPNNPTNPCLDGVPRPLNPDPTTPPTPTTQSVYSSGFLNYPRISGLSETMSTLYNTAYATQGYVPFGGDPSAFYSPLAGNNTDAWRNLSTGGAWPYDPTMAAYPYSAGYGGLDVRRKNATREATSTLKAWLYEHIKNPYPTKGEKIMLAIITKMTLTQVSTWFANARRRLKKENKMQWSPRNRTGDDDDDDKDGSDDEGEGHKDTSHDDKDDDDEDIIVDGCVGNDSLRISSPGDKSENGSLLDLRDNPLDISGLHNGPHSSVTPTPSQSTESNTFLNSSNSSDHLKDPLFLSPSSQKGGDNTESSQNKPRIWSMADMATPSQPPQTDKRSPTAIAQSLINKSGYTAFSSPAANNNNHHPHGHNHPVLNGSYHGLQPSSTVAAASGLSPYRLGSYMPGTTHGMLPNFHRPATINALAASTSCAQRLNSGVLVGTSNLEGPRLANISANSLENTATAFKPVPRRS